MDYLSLLFAFFGAEIMQGTFVFLASVILGLWFTWSGFGLSRLRDMLMLYEERRKTDVGARAIPPLFVQYLNRRWDQVGWVLVPVIINLTWWFGLDIRELWAWSGIGLTELFAGWWLQHGRGQRFETEWGIWLELTQPVNHCLDGYISYPAGDDWNTQKKGFNIYVVRDNPETHKKEILSCFIPFGAAKRYPIWGVSGQPLRIFYRLRTPQPGEFEPMPRTVLMYEIVGYQVLPETHRTVTTRNAPTLEKYEQHLAERPWDCG
ncbi:MAG: hypothetical protein IPJ68_02845 [Candidatus Moraniibacteriota bacterium]|nr:MAG: hypothetical protein IPJ68_02845 [Candidatus Moranbacteria bacterium]